MNPLLSVQRIALGIEYQGSAYHGWQKQTHDPLTLQAALEKALSEIAQQPITSFCAGRTDAGVHATYQVVHFETTTSRPLKAWMLGCNHHLPKDIAVKWVRPVSADFHARYSALYRRYQYFVFLSVARPALFAECLTHYGRSVDMAAMQQAAQVLIGEHDFTSFRAKDCQSRTPVREIHHLTFRQQGPYLCIEVQANAFLKHMVRNIVGSLLAVGVGDRSGDWLTDVLHAKDRSAAGVTAPPNGLFLVDVGYPSYYELPSAQSGSIPFPAAQSAGRS